MSGDTVFNAKDGITANTVFTANSTLTQANNVNVTGTTNVATLNVSNSVTVPTITSNGTVTANVFSVVAQVVVGSNVVVNTSTFSVGNSSVNVAANSTTIAVGSFVVVNNSQIYQGNSTYNTIYTSSGITVVNPAVSGTMNSSGVFLGNSTINASANSSAITIGANVVANQSQFFVGNSTSNGVLSQSSVFTSNAIINAVMNTQSFFIGNSTVNTIVSPLSITVGANVSLNVSTLSVGNFVINNSSLTRSTNVTLNSTSLGLSDSLSTFKVNTTIVSLGSNLTINTGSFTLGNSAYSVSINSQGVFVGNNTGNATMNTATVQLSDSVGDVMTITPTSISAGANVLMNQSVLIVGDDNVNVKVTSTGVRVSDSGAGNLTIGATSLFVRDVPGNSTAVVNTSRVSIGNSTTNFIVNTSRVGVGNNAGGAVLYSNGSNSVLLLSDAGGSVTVNTTSMFGSPGVFVPTLTTTTPSIGDVSNTVPTTAWVATLTPPDINVFRNSHMETAQRGTFGSVPDSTAAYSVDGWVLTGTGNSVHWSQQFNTDVARYELKINCRDQLANAVLMHRIGSMPYSCRLLTTSGTARPVTVQFTIFNATGASISPSLTTYFPTTQDNFSVLTQDLSPVVLQTVANGALGTVAYTFTPNVGISNGMLVQLLFDGGLNAGSGQYVTVVSADCRATPNVAIGRNPSPPTPDKLTYDKELLNNYQFYYAAPVALITRVSNEKPISSLTPPTVMYSNTVTTSASILSNSSTWVGSNASCNLTSGCVLLTTNTTQTTVGSYAVVGVTVSAEL